MVFFARNWFMLGLLLSMLVGYLGSDLVRPIEETNWVLPMIVATVMFAMALPVEFRQIHRVLRRPTAPLLASFINLGVAPLLAWPLSLLLGNELGPGLIVAAATPCTLASASVWTRKAGGNDAVSMMVTLLTNGVCFIVTPLWVRALTTGQVAAPAIAPLMLTLVFIVLVPIVLAQLIRARASVRDWSARRKTQLGVYAQLGVLSMVMFGIAQVTHRMGSVDAPRFSFALLLACAAMALALHLGLFWIGWQTAKWLKLAREDQIAMGFSSSQKTLMVGLATAIQLGLSAIPLIAYHVLQLVVDTWLANRLRLRSLGPEKTIVDPAPD